MDNTGPKQPPYRWRSGHVACHVAVLDGLCTKKPGPNLSGSTGSTGDELSTFLDGPAR